MHKLIIGKNTPKYRRKRDVRHRRRSKQNEGVIYFKLLTKYENVCKFAHRAL